MTSILLMAVALVAGLVGTLMADSYGAAANVEVIDAAIAGPFATANPIKIHLAQSPFTPGINVTLAGITEATFDGYGALSITSYGPPILQADGTIQVIGLDVLSWTPTGSTTPNTIGGWVAVDHAGNMVNNGGFNPPRSMNGGGTNITGVWAFGYKPGTTSFTVV